MHTAVDEDDVIYLYVDEPPGFWKFSIQRIFDVLSPLDMNGYMSTWEMYRNGTCTIYTLLKVILAAIYMIKDTVQ